MNRMKKFMALFLAVVLIAQTGFAASAQESASSAPSVQSETPTGTELQDEADATDTTEQQPEDSKDETTGETTETGQDGEDAAVGEVDGGQPGKPSEGMEGEQPEIPTDGTGNEQPGTPTNGTENEQPETPSEEQDGETPSGETGSGEESKEPAEEVTEPVEEEQGEEKLPAAENGLQLMNELDGAEEYSFTVDEENKTVQIDDAEDLRAWADSINTDKKDYSGYTIEIMNDIDLSDENWKPIMAATTSGSEKNADTLLGSIKPDVGKGATVIEGNGHTISNMTVYESENESIGRPITAIGFIGEIGYFADLTVKNITFENAHVSTVDGDNASDDATTCYAGVVIGHGAMEAYGDTCNDKLSFSNVEIVNSVVTSGPRSGSCAGGIVGYASGDVTFDNCHVSNSFMGGYNASTAILFGMGNVSVTVENCSANGVRLYSDGLNWKCAMSEDSLWVARTYTTPERVIIGENNTATDSCVVYPVIFHIAGKEIKQYVPVNTELRAFDDVWFGDIFEVASGKTIQWYNGTGADAEVVTQIIASLKDTDMYPYDMQALVNDEAYETQDTEKIANPLTHAAIELYAKEVTTIPTDPEAPDWETSKSKTATNLDSNYESQVTLSLPAAEELLETDVVFVLDKSTSTKVEDEAIAMLEALQQQVAETDAKINVGVVIFNRDAHRVLELEELNETNLSAITDAIRQEYSSGTNTHAGLLAGKAMLDEDTDVDAGRKYLIFISDGITYLFDDGEGNTTSIATEQYEWNAGKVVSTKDMTYTGAAMKYPYATNIFVQDGGVGEYLQRIGGLVASDGKEYWISYDSSLDNAKTLKSNRNETGKETLDEETFANYVGNDHVNDHANNLDTALYLTAQVYQEAVSAGYHCYAMTATTNEQNQNNYPWASQYIEYLNNGQSTDFEDIQKDIYYLLDAGSTVVDAIGKGVDEKGNAYDFNFVNDISKLKLTVGNENLVPVDLSEDLGFQNSNETARYGFGEYNSEYQSGYAFVLHYYANGQDGQSDECFVWDINTAVSNFAPVQLVYTVQLTNPQKAEGTYGQYDANGTQGYDGLYTNNSATLYPVDSNGMKGDAEEFNKPTVSYTVVDHPATINITKKVQNSSGAATNVNATFYAAVFTDPQFTNRFGDVVELKLNGTSQVTVSVTVEAPADGSSRSYYVTETDKNGNVITGGESFGYQIGIEGSMVTVSESAPTGSVTITNKQVASGNQGGGSNGGGSTGGGSSSGSGSSSSQTVTSAQTGDNTNLLLPIAVVVIAAAALTVCLVVYRRKRS